VSDVQQQASNSDFIKLFAGQNTDNKLQWNKQQLAAMSWVY